MDPVYHEEEHTGFLQSLTSPFTMLLGFLAAYGWWIVGVLLAALAAWGRLQPHFEAWRQAREDAEYHKDPDKVMARMEAVQRARDQQQQRLLEASERAKELEKEREERKRAEALERIQKYGAGGSRLGTPGDQDYLPLSGGASTSSYRPPKKSKCGGGGCGR